LPLEHAEPRLLRRDARLQLANTSGYRAQLVREHAGAVVGLLGHVPQLPEPAVHPRLLVAGIARCRHSGDEQTDGHQAGDGCLEGGATTHQPLFAPTIGVPSCSRSIARSASPASRRSAPTTAR
jgi:hypothetical protein